MAQDSRRRKEGQESGAGEAAGVAKEAGDGRPAGGEILVRRETDEYFEVRKVGFRERLWKEGGEDWQYQRQVGGVWRTSYLDRESGWEKLVEWGFCGCGK